MTRSVLAVTGAAGRVATALRPILREVYDLRLTDARPVRDVTPDECFVRADLRDRAALARAFEGTAGVLHLGGVAQEASFDRIYSANIEGMQNVLKAAAAKRVRRFVFASSAHVTGLYPRNERIDATAPVRPDTLYGASKAFGESLARAYAERTGIRVFCIRIGHLVAAPAAHFDLNEWISPRDLAQLIRIGLESPQVRYDVVYGVSNNERAFWNNAHAKSLGYEPQDSADDYAAALGAAAADERHAIFQGGSFAARGFIERNTA